MRVALTTTFRTPEEPLVALLDRVSDAFIAAGLDPAVSVVLADSPLPGSSSAVNRAARRFPALAALVTDAPLLPGGPPVHQVRSGPGGTPLPLLRAIAAGIPRSFPFHSARFAFSHAEFGPLLGDPAIAPPPGIQVRDEWWVNGRRRSLSALTVVEVASSHRGPLPVPRPVEAVIAACGTVEGTSQVALPEIPPAGPQVPPSGPQSPVAAIVLRYRENIAAVVAGAGLPHSLPPLPEALADHAGQKSGARKQVLERAFRPLGYDLVARSGAFTLSRRTAANHRVEVTIDTGTRSHTVSAFLAVIGPDFVARVPLPVAAGVEAAQYPIGDESRWRRIVENLAALVAELDRTFVPEIEAAAGPAPPWFDPGP